MPVCAPEDCRVGLLRLQGLKALLSTAAAAHGPVQQAALQQGTPAACCAVSVLLITDIIASCKHRCHTHAAGISAGVTQRGLPRQMCTGGLPPRLVVPLLRSCQSPIWIWLVFTARSDVAVSCALQQLACYYYYLHYIYMLDANETRIAKQNMRCSA